MTASRVMANSGYISEEFRQKVLDAARELNYEPNALARVMKGGQTKVIGVVVNSVHGPVAADFITALTEEARKVGMDVVIYTLHNFLNDQAERRPGKFLRGMWDGLIYVLPRVRDDYIRELEASPVPVVLINFFRQTALPVIRGDNFNGARDAVNSLIGLGHTRIGFVRGNPLSGQSGERERGYRQALSDAGLALDEALVVQGTFDEISGQEAAKILLALPERPTAIFCANDGMAFGCMSVAREMGLDLPGELSLIGFDDAQLSRHVQPRLTTLRHPVEPMAEAAVQELMRRIQKQPGQRQTMDFPSQLLIRESIAQPAHARRTGKK